MDNSKPPESNSPLSLASKRRTARVLEALSGAMKEMEREIDDAGGIYPYNHGRVSLAEVCRRAGVSNMTLQAPAHKSRTRKLVKDWIARLSNAVAVGRKSVRKAVNERASDWKTAHDKLATLRHVDELKVIQLTADLAESQRRIQDLELKNSDLLRGLSHGRGATAVVTIDGSRRSQPQRRR
jgi:hypothetical protein